jgi:hypothetical protein
MSGVGTPFGSPGEAVRPRGLVHGQRQSAGYAPRKVIYYPGPVHFLHYEHPITMAPTDPAPYLGDPGGSVKAETGLRHPNL